MLFYPPFLPSHLSNADVQRAEGTGGRTEVPPVTLPFFDLSTPVVGQRDPKREGGGRENECHSRASNALQIRVSGLLREKGRVSWGFSNKRGDRLVSRHQSPRDLYNNTRIPPCGLTPEAHNSDSIHKAGLLTLQPSGRTSSQKYQ